MRLEADSMQGEGAEEPRSDHGSQAQSSSESPSPKSVDTSLKTRAKTVDKSRLSTTRNWAEEAFLRAANEDDDGYDPYSDRPAQTSFFEEDPWR